MTDGLSHHHWGCARAGLARTTTHRRDLAAGLLQMAGCEIVESIHNCAWPTGQGRQGYTGISARSCFYRKPAMLPVLHISAILLTDAQAEALRRPPLR